MGFYIASAYYSPSQGRRGRSSLHVLNELLWLIGWASLLEDMECPILLVEEGGTLATKGVGGEMTSCFPLDPGFALPLPPLLDPIPFMVELGR